MHLTREFIQLLVVKSGHSPTSSTRTLDPPIVHPPGSGEWRKVKEINFEKMRHYLLLSLWCFLLRISNAFSTPAPRQIPITVISGFLGSGKTTLLQELLANKEGLKIAVIVNDMASINIDSKLVTENSQADGMVQLQNGCACCSLSDELLGSVSELVTMSDIRGSSEAFDHIVVELSGVADPKGVRSQFQEAMFYNMPLMERVRLDTLVTVIDCSVFLRHLRSTKTANRTDNPELFYREGEEVPEETETEDWMEDMPPLLLEALLAGDKAAANLPSQENNDAVAELLVSQTETADVVLLNKVDLVDDANDLTKIDQIVTALNAKANVERTTYGKVPLSEILAVKGGRGIAEAGVVDDHRDAVEAAEQVHGHSTHGHSQDGSGADHSSHSHSSHDHDHSEPEAAHDHSHAHSHTHSTNGHSHSGEEEDGGHSHSHEECNDPEAAHDPSHSHSHSHSTHDDHSHSGAGEDRGHSHSHSHSRDEVCNDPDCDDPSHSHSHSHVDVDELGIGSFVYRARKPFHPRRLVAFLRHLPISRGLPEKAEDEPSLQVPQSAEQALQRVVRSKGFMWLGDSNVAANYWSHSGTAFEMQCLGRWWSTLPRKEWPPDAVATILADFDDQDHEEGSYDSVGDRRQEVVFIGPGLSTPGRQEDIVSCLDQCLLDDEEWEEYKAKRTEEKYLRSVFQTALKPKMLSY